MDTMTEISVLPDKDLTVNPETESNVTQVNVKQPCLSTLSVTDSETTKNTCKYFCTL